MNKVLRIISIILLGAFSAAMFLMWTPLIKDEALISFALYKDEVKFVLPGLLFLSGVLCLRVFGFKNKNVLRIIVALLAIGVGVLAILLPEKVDVRGDVEIHTKYVFLGIGYVVVFLLLFVLHIVELGSRKGFSKIIAPLADLALMAFIFSIYVGIAVPVASTTTFGEYVGYVVKYGHYACGGLLAAEFLFAVIELFTRKAAV